jgi:tetratricopeptide (TPR) repeat protein
LSLVLLPAARAQPKPATTQESRFSRSAEAEITFQEGLLRYTNKQLPEAEEAFKKVIQTDPNDSEAYYYLGLAQVDQGKTAQAIDSFDRSLRLDPTRQEVRAARATANIRAGKYDAAREDVDALAPDPRWTSLVHYLRGQIAYAQGNLDVAAKEFSAAKTAGGTEAEPAGFYEGLTYLRMRQLVQARGAFRETAIDPIRDPSFAAAARQLDAKLAEQSTAGTARPWSAQLTLSYVYDSNVVQLGAIQVGGISHKADSRIVVQPQGSYNFLHTDKLDIGVQGSGYFAFQFDLNDFDIASYQAGPYINYRITDNLSAGAYYAFNYIEFGHDPYLNRNIVSPYLAYTEPNFGYTQLSYIFEARQFSEEFDTAALRHALDRDGQFHTVSVVQGITTPELFSGVGKSELELIYRFKNQNTVGSDYDYYGNEIAANFSTPLPFWQLHADAGVSYEMDNYRHPNTLDTVGHDHDKRYDQVWNATVGVQREIFKGCNVRVDYTYTNDDSNVQFNPGTGPNGLYSYDRSQVAVRLIYTF